MNAQEIIAKIRDARRTIYAGNAWDAANSLDLLEHEIAGPGPENFDDCPVEGFDTILSYLARTNPEAFELLDDPVHGTITDGIMVSNYARKRGLPVLRVAAPAYIRRRYPKAKTVNAYPTHLLVEIYG